jgi:hypothetical protein
MKEVTKEQFKEVYFKLGGGTETGWGLEYWNKFFEDEKIPGMKYLLEEPETPEHTRMMIVTSLNEHRLLWAPLIWFIILAVVDEKFSDSMQNQSTISWILVVSFVLSAIVAFGMTYHTNHSQPRKDFEIRTGREWFRRPTHSLFWLRSCYWGFGYLVIGVACFFLAPVG